MSQISPQAIQYSPQVIRWIYGDNTANNLANLDQIAKWWTNLHEKTVKIRSITGIQEINSMGAWQPFQEDPIEICEIQNPQISDDVMTFNGHSKIDRIEKIEYLDFDPIQNQLVVNLVGYFKTENPYTEPKKVYCKSHIKYLFTLPKV